MRRKYSAVYIVARSAVSYLTISYCYLAPGFVLAGRALLSFLEKRK